MLAWDTYEDEAYVKLPKKKERIDLDDEKQEFQILFAIEACLDRAYVDPSNVPNVPIDMARIVLYLEQPTALETDNEYKLRLEGLTVEINKLCIVQCPDTMLTDQYARIEKLVKTKRDKDEADQLLNADGYTMNQARNWLSLEQLTDTRNIKGKISRLWTDYMFKRFENNGGDLVVLANSRDHGLEVMD